MKEYLRGAYRVYVDQVCVGVYEYEGANYYEAKALAFQSYELALKAGFKDVEVYRQEHSQERIVP